MENTCQNCRHWDSAAEGIELPGRGICRLTHTDYRLPAPESLALARDLESCQAWLETAPEFGCVQFAKRDP